MWYCNIEYKGCLNVTGSIMADNLLPTLQSTLAKPVTLQGHGVHSGTPSCVTIKPAEPDTGIVFLRPYNSGETKRFKAISAETGATELSTVLGHGETRVETIEHLMAAIAAFNLDNLYIEVTANEMPILDGGSWSYCEAFTQAGTVQQDVKRHYLVVKKTIRVESPTGFAEFVAFDGRRFDVKIAFASQAIGESRIIFDLAARQFQEEISRARTFGFLKDVQTLWAAGMALGSSLENSLVIGMDEKIVNPEGNNYENEFVRHKLLDAIGDTALLGMPFIGLFRSFRGGHALNAQLVKALLEDDEAYEKLTFSVG